MCRNIRVLSHFEPPTTDEEVQAAAMQYVRKITGTRKPSRANEAAFARAVEDVARITRHIVDSMEFGGPPRTREDERAKARARAQKRYGSPRAATSSDRT